MKKFSEIAVGDRVKTKLSGMATVTEINRCKGTMIKLDCDKKRYSCLFFYESELDLTYEPEEEK